MNIRDTSNHDDFVGPGELNHKCLYKFRSEMHILYTTILGHVSWVSEENSRQRNPDDRAKLRANTARGTSCTRLQSKKIQ